MITMLLDSSCGIALSAEEEKGLIEILTCTIKRAVGITVLPSKGRGKVCMGPLIACGHTYCDTSRGQLVCVRRELLKQIRRALDQPLFQSCLNSSLRYYWVNTCSNNVIAMPMNSLEQNQITPSTWCASVSTLT